MARGPDRAEFTPATRALLAEQAGYKCSKCGNPTVGPHPTNGDRSYKKGRAAHIYAAAKGGPRPNPSMSAAELSNHENGIHLCIECADIVDGNKGQDFPAETLIGWKIDRKAAASAEFKGGSPVKKIIAGTYNVSGKNDVIGAEINSPTQIVPGTIFNVSGENRVIGIKIG